MGNTTHSDEQFSALLDYLRRNRGFDFLGYKRAGLMRRMRKRMQAVPLEKKPIRWPFSWLRRKSASSTDFTLR